MSCMVWPLCIPGYRVEKCSLLYRYSFSILLPREPLCSWYIREATGLSVFKSCRLGCVCGSAGRGRSSGTPTISHPEQPSAARVSLCFLFISMHGRIRLTACNLSNTLADQLTEETFLVDGIISLVTLFPPSGDVKPVFPCVLLQVYPTKRITRHEATLSADREKRRTSST